MLDSTCTCDVLPWSVHCKCALHRQSFNYHHFQDMLKLSYFIFCQNKYKSSFPRPPIPFCRNWRKTSFGFKAIVDLSSPVPLASTNYPLWLWLKLHHCVQNILCTVKLFQFSRFEICEPTGIFLIEFNGIYRIHRICRILFLVTLEKKIYATNSIDSVDSM